MSDLVSITIESKKLSNVVLATVRHFVDYGVPNRVVIERKTLTFTQHELPESLRLVVQKTKTFEPRATEVSDFLARLSTFFWIHREQIATALKAYKTRLVIQMEADGSLTVIINESN